MWLDFISDSLSIWVNRKPLKPQELRYSQVLSPWEKLFYGNFLLTRISLN